MATVTLKGANVTKYDAGGSGDNCIADGFIKSVEKVWIDKYSYTAANTIGAANIIELAVIPAGKKVTGVAINVLGIDQLCKKKMEFQPSSKWHARLYDQREKPPLGGGLGG